MVHPLVEDGRGGVQIRRIPAKYMRVYPEVSGLATWSENCKWYSSLPVDAVVLLFCESV
jgi:hypothetical protein